MLIKSEKNKKSLGRSFLSLASSKIIAYGLVLVNGMLLSRFRSLQEYGTYSQIILVINVATSVLMLGLPNSLNYYLARMDTPEEKNRFVSFYYTINTVLSIVVGLILVLITPLLEAYFKNPMLRSFLYFIAVYPWTKIIMSSVENLLVVFHKAKLLIFYRVANSGMLLFVILLVKWMGWTFRHYLTLLLIVEAVFSVIVYVFATANAGKLRVYFDRDLLVRVLKFSLPLGLSTAMGTLRMETDKLFIGFVLDTEKLALYTNAAKELPVTMIAASFTAVLLPHIARLQKNGKTGEAVGLWHDVTELSFIINTVISGCLFVFADEAVLFLYSSKYSEASMVFAIYSLTYILRSTYFGMILNTGGHTRLILRSSLISLGSNIVLNVGLYYTVGFVGPAIATVLSTLIGALYLLYHTAKITGMKYREIYPWKKCAQILVVNMILGVIFGFIRGMIPLSNEFARIAVAIALSCVWAGISVVIFRKTIREKLKTLNQNEG